MSLKDNITKNAHTIPKRWSAQMAIGAAIVALQEVLPFWEPLVPENTFVYISAVLMSLSVVMQAIKQANIPE